MTTAALETDVAPAVPPARRRRRRAGFRPCLPFLLLALAFLWPYRTDTLNPTNLRDVVVPTAEASRAIGEGQFPVRVAPLQLHGSRYPLFQFYGNLPFTACGAVHYALRVSPYTAWKIVVLLTALCGGYFTARLSYQFTRHAAGSIVAGTLFMTAPYYLSDLYQRTAYSEWTAFNLLPPALYFTLRTLVSRRARVKNIVGSAVFWTFVGLSHNITYLYGVLLCGLFVASYALCARRNVRKTIGRFSRVALAGVLHAALILWYVAPQLAVLNDLMMKERTTVSSSRWSTVACYLDLNVMLAGRPTKLPNNPAAPELGFQVGWAILAGIGLAISGLALARGRRNAATVARLGAVFVLAFLLAWSPLDWWPYFVGPFRYVQFSYRLLLFTVLFGALLGGMGISFWLPRLTGTRAGGWRGKLAAVVVLGLIAGVGCATRPYVPPDTRVPTGDLDRLTDMPDDFAGLEDYQISNDVAARSSWFHPDLNLAGWQYNLLWGDLQQRHGVLLPAPTAAAGLLVEGYVLPPGKELSESDFAAASLKIEVDGRAEKIVPFVSAAGEPAPESNAPAGSKAFSVVLPLDPDVPLDTPTPVSMQVEYPGDSDMARALRLTKVQWQSPAPGAMDDRELRSAETIATQLHSGDRVIYRFANEGRRVLLQMPVLYYPKGLLDVRDFHKPIAYGNVGRYVAVDLPPGAHTISVQFNGLKQANVVSGLAWGGVIVVGVMALFRRRKDALHGSPRRRNVGGVMGVLGVAALVGGIGGERIVANARTIFSSAGRPIEVVGIASSEARPDQSVANLFDYNPTTEWAALGGTPARLVLVPRRAGRLRSIELEARGEALYEAWRRVRVVLSLKGQTVLEKQVEFPDADKVRVQRIETDGVITDRVELEFSDPVLMTVAGEPIPPGAVNPGYRELRAHWDGRRNATPTD